EGAWLEGFTYARWGKYDQAREALKRLKAEAKNRYVSPVGLSIVHAALGERDEAFELLEEAYRVHDGELFNLKVEPRLDDLRGDRRYSDLLERLGLSDVL